MQKWLIIAGLIALMSGAAYYYYSTTQSRIEKLVEAAAILEQNKKQLETANEENLKAITDLQESYKQVEEQYGQIQSEFQVIRTQNNELRERLGRHDLSALAAAKPKLVENIINKASDKALRCFELASGAPLTETERNAKNENEFNSECPWVYYELLPTP